MKILIVDDDFVSRALLMNTIKDFGYVDIAVSAEEAITAFNSSHEAADPYDLILLDRVMPEKYGDIVLNHIRDYEEEKALKSFELTKVIMVTALKKPEQVFTSFREQCEGYIIKPISRDKVIETIEHCGIKLKKLDD